MPFRFRLQKVLDLTLTRESAAKLEIARERANLNELMKRQALLKEEIGMILKRSSVQNSVDAHSQFFNDKIELNLGELSRLKPVIIECENKIDEKLTQLQQVMQKRKALESLAEKQRLEYQKARSKKEQKQMEDQFLSIRHAEKYL